MTHVVPAITPFQFNIAHVSLIAHNGFSFHWAWTRPPRSKAEFTELNSLISLLPHLSLSDAHDTWECCLNDSRVFSVSSIHRHITHHSPSMPDQRYKWNKLLPIKVNITSWRIANRRLPTRINLDKRGIDLNSVRCPIRDEALETEDHLLFYCNLANKVWKNILKW
ncbi:reverse transcriptase domain, Reverse transcriptase zinc-binding domain protein [Artemisia annua]|uniref:Reverse transcriptase domain, Reverse transcriptase zinc-binding domain protein n=1 Tax=Artemisia annua TaxID=35608 RepID=A0A2U1N0T8_ARTAN|nr:reverse transcriptase domain, Reverse transcriptase zinc-binding domain protein [Artemisia annua]